MDKEIHYNDKWVTSLHQEYTRHIPLGLPSQSSLSKVAGFLNFGAKQDTEVAAAEGAFKAKQILGDSFLFAPDCTPDDVKSVTLSMMFAQLAANVKVPKADTDNTYEWYSAYCDVLLNIGWPSAGFEFKRLNMGQTTFEVKTELLKIVANMVTAGVFGELSGDAILKSVTGMIDALEKDGSYSKLYAQGHKDARDHSFSVGIVTRDPTAGVPIVHLCAFQLNVDAKTISVLWFKYHSDKVDLQSGSNRVILQKEVFERVRPTIQKRLGDHAEDYAANIPLPKLD